MPIIPSDWTGIETVNAENMGGSAFPIYQFSKSFSITISELNTFIDLIGFCDAPINREISLDILSGSLQLYWKNYDNSYTQITKNDLNFNNGYGYVDTTLGQLGLSVKITEPTELFLVIRWDKDFDFNIYTPDISLEPQTEFNIAMLTEDTFSVSNFSNNPIKQFNLIFDYFSFNGSSNNSIIIVPQRKFEGTFNPGFGVWVVLRKGIDITPDNLPIPFELNLEGFELPEWDFNATFKIGVAYDNPDLGLIFNPTYDTVFSYNSETETFTLTVI